MTEHLGKGSQGVVHACVCRETGRKCAVKLIDRCSRSAWTTFRREVEMCKQACECPFVVDILDEFVDTSSCYVVMPKYSCHLRKAFKATSRMPGSGVGLENKALRRLVLQGIAALTHLHSLEIIHRDVKAQNFLADRLDLRDTHSKIVLSDFGLARKLAVGHHLSAQVGTRKYWAPDVYLKKYWHNADVFGIGVLIFLAGSGAYPYYSEEEACNRDIFRDGIVPPILTQEARDFMRLCLIKDPHTRPGSHELHGHTWLRTPMVETPSVAEESVTVANQDGESVSTAMPMGSAQSLSTAASPVSIGGKLGRSLVVPLPVPLGDDADHLEASDMEDIAEFDFESGRADGKGDDGEETSVADGEAGSRYSSISQILDTSPIPANPGGSFPQLPSQADPDEVEDGSADFGDEIQWHFAY